MRVAFLPVAMTVTVTRIASTPKPASAVEAGGDAATASAFLALLAAFGRSPQQDPAPTPTGGRARGLAEPFLGRLSAATTQPGSPPAAFTQSSPTPALRSEIFPAVQEGPALRPQPLPGTVVVPSPAVPGAGEPPSLPVPADGRDRVALPLARAAPVAGPDAVLGKAGPVTGPVPAEGRDGRRSPVPPGVRPPDAAGPATSSGTGPVRPATPAFRPTADGAPSGQGTDAAPVSPDASVDSAVPDPGGGEVPSPVSEMPRLATAAPSTEVPTTVQRSAMAGVPQAVLRPTEVPAMVVRTLADGQHRLLVSLEPARLGQVRIAVEVGSDGRVTLRMRAQKQEALERLQRETEAFGRIFAVHGLRLVPEGLSFELMEDAPDDGASDGADIGFGTTPCRSTGFVRIVERLLDVRT